VWFSPSVCAWQYMAARESMRSFTVKVEQMIAREVRVARGWLIAVAVLTFGQQMLYAFNLPPKLQGKHQFFVILACAEFAVFLGLWLLARKNEGSTANVEPRNVKKSVA